MGQNDACQLGNWRFKKLDFGCWGLILGGLGIIFSSSNFWNSKWTKTLRLPAKADDWNDYHWKRCWQHLSLRFFRLMLRWKLRWNHEQNTCGISGWWLMPDLFTRESWGLGPGTMDDHSHLLSPRFSTRLRSNGFKAKSVAKTSQFLSSSRLAIHLSTMSCQRKSCSTFNHQ